MLKGGFGLALVLAATCWVVPAAAAKTPSAHPRTPAKPNGASSPIPPLPVRKSAARAAAPEPDVWPQADIEAALARCAKQLAPIDAVAEHVAPIKQGKCGTPAPIRLNSLGKKYRVAFSPPALVNCDMAVALNRWLDQEVQPLAAKHLNARIVTIEVISDYACRASTGRRAHNRLSEHAYADALDIRGFVTNKGRAVRVLQVWGETQRDVAMKAAAAQAAEKAAAEAAAKAEPDTTGKASVALPVSRKMATRAPNLATRLGGPAGEPDQDHPAKVAALSPQLPAAASTPKEPGSLFLRAAHAAACRIFGTTLGPEANEAHRNHFHVDMAERKYKRICD